MKNIIIALFMILPFLATAQNKKGYVVTQDLQDWYKTSVEKAKLPTIVKTKFKMAITAAICEVVNPWTGECDIWMDPDDPLPSTQGLKNQGDRAETIRNFEKSLQAQSSSKMMLQDAAGQSINLSNEYGQHLRSGPKNPILRMQGFLLEVTDAGR